MPQVNPIVIFMTVAYFAVIFGIGYATRKASADPMDYYVAGRKIGPVVNGAALAATFLSPASFLGLPAFIFLLGYPFWWAMVGIIGGMPLATMLTAAPLRKYAPVSFTDYYCDRYEDQKLMRIITGIPILMGTWAYVVLSLVGTGLFMMAILQIPYVWAVIIGAVAVLFYVYMGGMVATTWSTAFQGVLMAVAAVVCGIAVLMHYGGFGNLADAIFTSTPNFWLMPYVQEGAFSHPLFKSWTGVFGFFFVWHFGFATMPYSVVRFFTAMDVRSARKSVIWTGVFGGAMYWGLIIIGSAARHLIETLHPLMGGILQTADGPVTIANVTQVLTRIRNDFGVGGAAITDYSMIAAIEALNNPWLLGLLVAGGLAIAMSTAAGWLVVGNVLLGRDWLAKAFGNKWAIENPIKSLRLMTVLILLVGVYYSFNPLALVLDLSGWAFVMTVATLGVPLVLGLWWPRATKTATYATIIVFFPLVLYSWLAARSNLGSPHWFFLSELFLGEGGRISTPHQIYWVPVAFIFFIIVSLFTKPASQETITKYCDDLHV
ncbi:MAG: cation acetate symporter [Dethiobacter sp.]|jgi:SSS family solute:Na+ symporter|nr:cation acetate symporter [Dethiobacter sp.]MBS3898653.1 cation acetate symporter [Dethiobacter sp.]MBS3983148.1 cation acetate symporter [Dethiobacter sp.]MCL4462324.1 cation acetate symporter [Bacillota bacterium]